MPSQAMPGVAPFYLLKPNGSQGFAVFVHCGLDL
jgi:hypothetical protein